MPIVKPTKEPSGHHTLNAHKGGGNGFQFVEKVKVLNYHLKGQNPLRLEHHIMLGSMLLRKIQVSSGEESEWASNSPPEERIEIK